MMAALVVGGILGCSCICGGIYAIYRNAVSPSELALLGNKLTTGHVGVAFVFIGMVVLGSVLRKAFTTLVDLGKIPNGTSAQNRWRIAGDSGV